MTGVDVTSVRVVVTGTRYTASVWSAAWRLAMIAVVTRRAELPGVTRRAPAFLHVHCQLTYIRRFSVLPYGSCKYHVVEETKP